ncbi:MAG: peptidoglycan DD-metalloendopeptidase family protein [Eubacteriales bacterium]|nr:peptidoglycan DD-metalloendopeptidase family protein [Eubacteriales bacterium]
MKKSRGQGRKIHSLWKDLASGILDKINTMKNSRPKERNDDRDMRDTHTPISRMDLTGMNREQAKEMINRIIDEKLEMVSHLELTELQIDYREKEKQRAKAAERINERRNRRKHRSDSATETIITEQGIYSNFKQASVFDIIQPEPFPEEGVHVIAPIEGQLSIMDAIEVEPEAEYSMTQEPAGVSVNTSLDEAVDKVFASLKTNKNKGFRLCQKIHRKTGQVFKFRIMPAATACKLGVSSKLIPLLQKIESRLRLRNKTAAALKKLAEGEKRTAGKVVLVIDCIDRWNEAFLHRTEGLKQTICHRADLIREYAERHKRLLLVEFGCVVAVAATVTIMIGNMTAYEYIYNGKVLGAVKNQEDVYKTIDIIGDKLSVQYDADITINKEKDIRFNKVVAFKQDIDDQEDILNRLTYMRDMKANGRGIYIDDKLVAVLESDRTAKAILNEIQNKYLKENANIEYTKVGFAEDVVIKDVETKLGNIEAKEKALEYMMTGAVEQRIHLVQSGETFSEIAKMYGMKQSELQGSNPDVVPEKLHIGQEICLNQIVPLVTVQTTEVAQYKEAIPYEIQYENTGSLFKNEQTVKSRGTNGEKDVVAEIVRNNGIEVSRKEISATILSQPVSQVVLVGTKEPPPLIGTGTFIYPIRGTLTSRYGTRWGRLHSGIDLAAPTGTHIKAADGGKVTFSGYNGALGYMVAIDHGGGRVTWYGHCSKLFVKKGERVYQGQHIANVGNTGRSTGPHVHFEVHINGKTKNPLNYL